MKLEQRDADNKRKLADITKLIEVKSIELQQEKETTGQKVITV